MQDAQVVVARPRKRGSREQRSPRADEHAERQPPVTLDPFEQQVRRYDQESEQDGAVQVRPERDQRHDQPDS